MLNFAWPWMFLLLPLPWLVLKLKYRINRQQLKTPAVISFPKLQQVTAAFKNAGPKQASSFNWQHLLLLIAWICLVIGLMRPQLIKDIAYANNTGYDLMLAVDISRSMDIVDFREDGQPISRINATKKVVSNFVQQRAGDRLGLIVFAENAYLTIPLTLDTNSVIKMLNNLIVGMAGESTAIGDAIGIGVQNLRKRPLSSRVLILLTDGDDTASHIPPLEAAKLAAGDKIKIYTIGVGNKLDEALLKKIATLSGGTYFKVTNVSSLQEVYKKIDQLEKSESKDKALLIKTPLYHVFVCIALLCLAVYFSLNTKYYRFNHEFK